MQHRNINATMNNELNGLLNARITENDTRKTTYTIPQNMSPFFGTIFLFKY
jgi:hypothetical protein